MKIKTQFFIVLMYFGSFTVVFAQWVGTNTTNNVGIGTTNQSTSIKLLVQGDPNWTTFYSKNNGYNGYLHVLNSGGGGLDAPQLNIIDNGNNQIFHVGGDGQRFMYYNGGNFGIGTSNPEAKLQIGNTNDGADKRIKVPGVYNFEQLNFRTIANGNGVIEFITHSNQTHSGAVKFVGIDGGGLAIETASPADSYSALQYVPRIKILNSGTLDVNGRIRAQEINVCLTEGCDFVFYDDYELMKLQELEKFIRKNRHLPGIASANEMIETGLDVKAFQMQLLQKVEELTLYTIQQSKDIEELKKIMQLQNDRIEKLETALMDKK